MPGIVGTDDLRPPRCSSCNQQVEPSTPQYGPSHPLKKRQSPGITGPVQSTGGDEGVVGLNGRSFFRTPEKSPAVPIHVPR